MTLIHARRFDTDEPVCVSISNGALESVEPFTADNPADLPIIAPGLFDLQVNGYAGCEFASAEITVEDVHGISQAMAEQGVARYLPTVTTSAPDVLHHALATIAAASESSPAGTARIAGIHLEGPFISAEDGPRGAHPAEHCCAPSWELFEQLQASAGGKIRLLTIAAELPRAAKFIRQATQSGVIVALGHTSAKHEQIQAAVDAGARLSTHLGNGAHPILPRHPNYIWSQLAEDRLHASLIADGFHLPPEVLKSMIRAKTPERCLLISDMSGFAGMPPGRYQTSLCELELLANGKLVIASQTELLAAASMPLTTGIANVAEHADVSRATAIALASIHPARFLGEEASFLERGCPAHFTLMDWPDEIGAKISIRGTIVLGEVVDGHIE